VLRSEVARISTKRAPSTLARLLADPTLASYEHDLAAMLRSFPELPPWMRQFPTTAATHVHSPFAL